MLRRSADSHAGQPQPSGTASWGHLTIDCAEQLVTLAGRPLELTYLEQRMLFDLSLRADEVQSHAELLPRVWGPAHSGRTGAVRTLITQLRGKLGDDADVPRVGYRMPKPDGADGTRRAGRGRLGPLGRTPSVPLQGAACVVRAGPTRSP